MEDEPDFRWQFVVNYPEDISAEVGDSGFMKNYEGSPQDISVSCGFSIV